MRCCCLVTEAGTEPKDREKSQQWVITVKYCNVFNEWKQPSVHQSKQEGDLLIKMITYVTVALVKNSVCWLQIWLWSFYVHKACSILYSPLPVYVGSLCHAVFLDAHCRAPSWFLLPPGSKAARAALHRTAEERGPSPDKTVHAKRPRQHGALAKQRLCLNMARLTLLAVYVILYILRRHL